MSKIVWLSLAVCLLLGACVETRFESPLGEAMNDCDPRWKGLWLAEDKDSQADDGTRALTGINVDEACAVDLFEQDDADGSLKRTRIPLHFVRAAGKDHVVVTDSALASIGDIPAPHDLDPVPSESYFFLRYRLRGDRLELRHVDSVKAAKLVLDGKLDGNVRKTRNELHVYVRGSPSQLLEAVRRYTLFESDASIVFKRSAQSMQEFERAVQQNNDVEAR